MTDHHPNDRIRVTFDDAHKHPKTLSRLHIPMLLVTGFLIGFFLREFMELVNHE